MNGVVEREGLDPRDPTSRAARSSTCPPAGRRSSSASSSGSGRLRQAGGRCCRTASSSRWSARHALGRLVRFNAGSAVARTASRPTPSRRRRSRPAARRRCGPRWSGSTRQAVGPRLLHRRGRRPQSSSPRAPASSRRPSAVFVGVLAAVVSVLRLHEAEARLGYDDALDTFGVHGVGGTMGASITGFLATPEVTRTSTRTSPGSWADALDLAAQVDVPHARPLRRRRPR